MNHPVVDNTIVPRNYHYEVWDVFTSVPLRGNQLAVFLDASGLTAAEMLDLTREMNFSESTFVFPDGKVRIFTRAGEVPFAGHPALGTAMSLWTRNPAPRITLDLPAGRISVTFKQTSAGPYGEVLQPEPVFAETRPRELVAPLIGLAPRHILPDWPIENVSTGRPNLIVMLDSLAAIRAVRMNWPEIEGTLGPVGLYLLTREVENPAALVHARKLTPAGEDPATGSAAGSAAAWLVRHGLAKSSTRITIEQGSEMHRPSLLYAQATRTTTGIADVRVGGHAVLTAAGTLTLPDPGPRSRP